MEGNVPDFEPILEELGAFGKYQISQHVLQALGAFIVAYPVMLGVFIGYEPPHTCNSVNLTEMRSIYGIADNATLEATYETCSIHLTVNTSEETTTHSLGCVNGHNYSSDFHVSYVTEMNLVCDKAGLGELTQTLLMLGQGFGGFFFSSLSDRFGRKPIYVITSFGQIALYVLITVAPDVTSLTIFRFLIGGFQQGLGVSSHTLFLEMFPPKLRTYSGVISGTLWGASLFVLSLVAWLLRYHSWRTLNIVMVAFSSYTLLLPWLLDESPRWLACNNKPKEALRIFEKWCKRNGNDINHIRQLFQDNVINRLEKCKDQGKGKTTELRVERYTVLDLLRRNIVMTTLIVIFIWVTNGLTYFGLTLTSSSLSGDRYLNFFLFALAECPANLVMYILLKRVGRKTVQILFLNLAAVSLITSVLLTLGSTDAAQVASIVFSLVGKFAISCAFNVLFLYTPELFPTNIRSIACGVSSSSSRIGGMVSPYFKYLAEIAVYGPGAIFGGMCLISSFLMQLLPETTGRALPSSIEELKMWQRDRKVANKKNDFSVVVPPPEVGQEDREIEGRESLVESWMDAHVDETGI